MIPFLGLILAAGASPNIPSIVSPGGTGSGTLTATISFNSDGSTTTTFTGASPVTGEWYNPPVGSPGNSYYISFHKTSGSAWTAGLVDGTVYTLSSNRTLSWTTGSSIAAIVTASFWLDAGGTQSVGTCSIDMSIN